MQNNKRSTRTPGELLGELQTLVVEAEAMITDSVGKHSAEAFRALRTRFGDARERFTEVYDDAKLKVVAGAERTDAAIRAKPYQSLGIALGVGLLTGVLLGRRR